MQLFGLQLVRSSAFEREVQLRIFKHHPPLLRADRLDLAEMTGRARHDPRVVTLRILRRLKEAGTQVVKR